MKTILKTTLQGRVVSTKMDKTIVVVVDKKKIHPLYQKPYKISQKYYAHDEKKLAKKGNQVIIKEAKPKSKLKRWQLVEVVRDSRVIKKNTSRLSRGEKK